MKLLHRHIFSSVALTCLAAVGVLTEQHGLYLRMTGAEYLDFFGKVYRMDAATRQKRSTACNRVPIRSALMGAS